MTGAREWVLDERLWAESYESMFPAGSFEAARQDVDRIVTLAGVRGGALLDVACGPGRHAIPFAQRGFAVAGLDVTPFLLEKARAYAADAGVEVEWLEQDMRELSRPDEFDLAICMFTSFGVFEAHADNQCVLENVHRSLRPGGAFVLDVGGKEVIARIYQAAATTELEDGRLFIQRRQVVDEWSRMDLEWLYVRGDEVLYRKRFQHWIYSARELRLMLEAAGFSDVTIYGDLAGAPYDQAAKRLVTVARKG